MFHGAGDRSSSVRPQVYSVFRLCKAAREHDIPIGVVNIGTTRADPLTQFKLEARCSSALLAACGRLGVVVDRDDGGSAGGAAAEQRGTQRMMIQRDQSRTFDYSS